MIHPLAHANGNGCLAPSVLAKLKIQKPDSVLAQDRQTPAFGDAAKVSVLWTCAKSGDLSKPGRLTTFIDKSSAMVTLNCD